MHSERDKMNKYAWWETDEIDKTVKNLKFVTDHGAKEIASIWQAEDGLWWGRFWESFWGARQGNYPLGGSDMGESGAKAKVNEAVTKRWQGKANYYKDMLEKFTSQEGVE